MNIQTDHLGFLKDLTQWNEQVCIHLATLEKITLTPEHLEVIFTIREFYQTFELSPAMRPLCKFLKLKLGPDKASSIYLMTLFGQSPAKMAAKLAGLPKPDNCL
ncbi:TusE/DsrC/DsvC family sulfur relay protein [Marinicellulosiphila megalodicopiae]|uniref:TusE/DsrC/DsvC family sulfur relay protein n=1 Tax=Marinicellulosiphila megalodicopiae TaxID=2724896 RepID=UPI003BAF83F1